MTKLHHKRFVELFEQMVALEESQKPTLDSMTERYQQEIDSNALLEWAVKAKNLLAKSCGEDSEHYREFVKNQETGMYGTYLRTLLRLRAVFTAAKEDFEGGYLTKIRTIVQAELFDSELEQAKELLDAGYRLPAAVVAGTVLETSLRELCANLGLPTGRLNKMNDDLAKQGAYTVLVQKKITALADIRNSAAHGHPEKFSDSDVKDMIRDVKRLITEELQNP